MKNKSFEEKFFALVDKAGWNHTTLVDCFINAISYTHEDTQRYFLNYFKDVLDSEADISVNRY